MAPQSGSEPAELAHRWGVEEDGKRVDYGQLRRERIEAHGVRVEMPGGPALVAGHGVSSGPIPRRASSISSARTTSSFTPHCGLRN
jgi:hypothetical protein